MLKFKIKRIIPEAERQQSEMVSEKSHPEKPIKMDLAQAKIYTFKEVDGRHSILIHFPQILGLSVAQLESNLGGIPDEKWISGTFMGQPIPRIVRWYQKDGGTYKYSGKKYKSFPYEDWLEKFQNDLNSELNEVLSGLVSAIPGFADIVNYNPPAINSVLINKYRSGSDSIAWHSDDEPEFGVNPTIVSLSLGQSRTFKVKCMTEAYREKNCTSAFVPNPDYKAESYDFNLEGGSLLIMAGAFQDFWVHHLPKEPEKDGIRYNLTFRPYVKL